MMRKIVMVFGQIILAAAYFAIGLMMVIGVASTY